MPVSTPKKSGVHRVACFALYRALLQQSRRVTGVRPPFVGPFSVSGKPGRAKKQNDADTIFDILRRQFRASTGLQGHQIVSALKIGYEALHFLRSANSPLDPSALSRLARDMRALYPLDPLLQVASNPQTASSAAQTDRHGITPSGRPNDGPRVWRHPSTSATRPHILKRPLPQSALSGKRHVPRMTSTNGIVFLRITKPQPAYLSRVIRDKRERQQRRVDMLGELKQRWLQLAEAEDIWDRRVRRMFRMEFPPSASLLTSEVEIDEDSDGTEASYAEGVRAAVDTLSHLRHAERARDRRWGERLFAIVMKERQLKFEEEGVWHPLRGTSPERRRIMAQQRRERRRARAERKASEEEQAKKRKALRVERRARNPTKVGEEPFVVRLEE